jgi:poly(A) polymerase
MSARIFAIEVVKTLREAGHEALFAGGCVRDQLLGRTPVDFDVATSATPDQVQRLFRKTIAVGVAFGVVEVLGPKPHKIQVATFRTDGPYSDGRHPDRVLFTSARDDAMRRDFTINGLFFDPIDERLIDYVGGETDLKAGVLRAIGDPPLRFREDRLRLLRAVRFAARFELAIEPLTMVAIKAMAGEVAQVSGERIAEELRKLLVDPHRARGAELLEDTGLRIAVLPETKALDSARHLALKNLGYETTFPAALAVYLGNIEGTEINAIADRLRLANHDQDRAKWLVRHRQSLVEPERLPGSTLKPLLAHSGIQELLDLHRATGHAGAVGWCEIKLLEWPLAVLDPPPLITGEDLISMGMAPGPEFKRILDQVRNAQLDENLNDRESAIRFVTDQSQSEGS